MTNALRKILAAAALWAAFASSALAQSSPGWTYGYVPTPAQWNAAFAAKQDYVGSAFLPLSGGTMTGRLTTSTPNSSGSGFNLPQGADPSSPNNGDMWTTSAGLKVRVNGVTVNLTATVSGAVQVFATKAAAAAATIDAAVNVIQTLGNVAANDGGGARYVRTGSTGATAYRFQTFDGQWWTLGETLAVTPEMFACFGGGADCTAALQTMSTWMTTIAPDGMTYEGKPGAAYLVWSNAIVTPSPSTLFSVPASRKLTFNFNGSYFTTDNVFASGVRVAFAWNTGAALTFNRPKIVQSAYTTPLDSTKGVYFFASSANASTASSADSTVIINDAEQDGGIVGFSCSNGDSGVPSDYMPNPSNGPIFINGYKVSNVYYPLSFQSCGDNVTARGVVATNTGREYFPYNVFNHDIQITGDGGGPFDQILLKSYADPRLAVSRRGLQDVHVRYRNVGRINATTSATLAVLEFQQTVASPTVSAVANNGSGLFRLTVSSTANMVTGQTWSVQSLGGNPGSINGLSFVVTVINGTTVDLQSSTFGAGYTSGGYLAVPSHMKNVTVDFDVDDTNGNQQPRAFTTRKLTSAGTTDVNGAGYVIDNVAVRGTLRNYNYGIPAIDAFANTGTPGAQGVWSGDYITNFSLRDLKVTGTNSSIVADLTNGLLGNFVMRDVYCSSGVTTTITNSSSAKFRPQNVACGSIVDRVAVQEYASVGSQWLKSMANGVFTSTQPGVSDLSGFGTGVAAALAINVGTSGSVVVNGGALGTPSSGTVTNLTGTASININGTVGATTPTTGSFTTVVGSTSVQTPILKSASTITFQINGSTQAGIVSTAGKWLVGLNTTIGSGPRFAINENTASMIPNPGITNSFTMAGSDDNYAGIVIQAFANSAGFTSPTISTTRTRGTGASQTKVLSGDTLYTAQYFGCYGAGTCTYSTATGWAGMLVKTTEDWNDATHNGARMDFYATPTATGAVVNSLSIQNSVMAGTNTDGNQGEFIMNNATYMMRNRTSWTNGAAAQTGTLTNAPSAGNPTKWIAVDDNGTSRKIPAW